MKTKTNLVALSLLLGTAGCTTATLNDAGAKVVIVDTLSASDARHYEFVSEVKSIGMQSTNDCRNDLRNQASEKGATIVRVTSTEPDFCGVEGLGEGATKKCLTMHGEAFKAK